MKGLIVLYYVFLMILFHVQWHYGLCLQLIQIGRGTRDLLWILKDYGFFSCLGGGAMHQRDEGLVHFFFDQ